VAHGNSDAAIAGAASHDAVESPSAGDCDESGFVVTISFHLNRVHLKRNQRWRITPSVHVRLVARDVGVVHDPWIGDHRVDHRRRGEERGGPARHRRRRLGRGHRPVLHEVYALGELQPVVDRFGEIHGHRREKKIKSALECED